MFKQFGEGVAYQFNKETANLKVGRPDSALPLASVFAPALSSAPIAIFASQRWFCHLW
jgi:hypothetical protein